VLIVPLGLAVGWYAPARNLLNQFSQFIRLPAIPAKSLVAGVQSEIDGGGVVGISLSVGFPPSSNGRGCGWWWCYCFVVVVIWAAAVPRGRNRNTMAPSAGRNRRDQVGETRAHPQQARPKREPAGRSLKSLVGIRLASASAMLGLGASEMVAPRPVSAISLSHPNTLSEPAMYFGILWDYRHRPRRQRRSVRMLERRLSFHAMEVAGMM